MFNTNINENFSLISAGDSTSIKDSTKVTKNFENNQKINRSMMVESVTKLVNNVSQDVMQKNSVAAAASVGASNTIMISGVNCDEIEISGINQNAKAVADLLVKSKQSNASKISTEISTNIDKTIEKVGATDLAALEAENTKQLNDYMNTMPGYDPNKAQKLASQCPEGGSLFSAGNSCDVSSEYELNASVKKSLDLDESFKINDTDNISNDIKNKVEQDNFASCQSNASAANAIIIQNIQCGVMSAVNAKKNELSDILAKKPVKRTFKVTDVQQDALATLYMTCVFDQQNVSEIANKITNSISKKYNQIYDAVQKKATTKGPEWLENKMKIVDAFAAAGVEKIMAAAGDLPVKKVQIKTPDSQSSSNKTTESTSDKKVDPTFNDPLPERKGFPVDNKSGSNNLDDFRSKQIKIALADAKKTQADAEFEADKIKQKALDDVEAIKKKALFDTGAITNKTLDNTIKTSTDQVPQWMIYGGIILGIIIVFFIVKSLIPSKSKRKAIKEDDESDN